MLLLLLRLLRLLRHKVLHGVCWPVQLMHSVLGVHMLRVCRRIVTGVGDRTRLADDK